MVCDLEVETVNKCPINIISVLPVSEYVLCTVSVNPFFTYVIILRKGTKMCLHNVIPGAMLKRLTV